MAMNERIPGIETLRAAVAYFDACNEAFNLPAHRESFTVDELLAIYEHAVAHPEGGRADTWPKCRLDDVLRAAGGAARDLAGVRASIGAHPGTDTRRALTDYIEQERARAVSEAAELDAGAKPGERGEGEIGQGDLAVPAALGVGLDVGGETART